MLDFPLLHESRTKQWYELFHHWIATLYHFVSLIFTISQPDHRGYLNLYLVTLVHACRIDNNP